MIILNIPITANKGFACGSDGIQSACNAGDSDLIPGSDRFPGEGNGNFLIKEYLIPPVFLLGKFHDRGVLLKLNVLYVFFFFLL